MRARDGWAFGLAALLAIAGVAHFAAPDSFDSIVPHVLPASSGFWTFLSGLAELALAVTIAIPASRRFGATLAAIFFVLVLPANIQMAVDWWSTRSAPEVAVALARIPLQIPLIWWAWKVRERASALRPERRPAA
jgi:uncharacterized membrane protein